MENTAKSLRKMVIENALELGRVPAEQLGSDDFKELTGLYTDLLDALTDWAEMDYNHRTTMATVDKCFAAAKAFLALFQTDDDRITIDEMSLRSLRDMSTRPKRYYSKAYRDAAKALKDAEKTLGERAVDIVTLGIAMPDLDENPDLTEWAENVRKSGVNTTVNGLDMLSMFLAAYTTVQKRSKKVDDVKKAGKWTWRRPEAVSVSVFADLCENYVADALLDENGLHIKTSKAIRDEKAAAKAEKTNK